MDDALKAQRWLRAIVGGLALLAIVFHASAVVVREGESLLVMRLGRPLHSATEPGLHFRLPWPIDRGIRLDMRRRVYEGGHTEMLTRDKRNVIARVFMVWRIGDPLAFVQAVGTAEDAEAKLDGLLTNAAIGTLGSHDLAALVSTDSQTLKVEAIEAELLERTAPIAARNYGVVVESIRLQRISLPEENVAAVYAQMRAERRQFAARYKAEGELEASRIRAEADLAAARIRAEGAETAARIRGDAEAEVARLLAEAQAVDPELFRFVRSLAALEAAVGPNANLVLRTDAEPFTLLERREQP